MSKNERRPYRPGDRAKDVLASPAAPDSIDEFIENWLRLYLQDQTSAVPAFQALSAIASFWSHQERTGAISKEDFDGSDPRCLVPVPWWVVCALAKGWWQHKSDDKPFDIAFGVKATGQGNKPTHLLHEHEIYEFNLAVEIETLRMEGMKVGTAIRQVSDRFGVGEESLKRFRKKHRKRVDASLSHYE